MKRILFLLYMSVIFINSCKYASLEAEVGTYNSGSLIITNKSNETWKNINISVRPNKGGGEASYLYFMDKLESGLKVVVEKRDFVNKLGERFPYSSDLSKIKIECDQGSGEWEVK